MAFEWALELVYCVNVVLFALLIINIANMQYAGFHYITSQCDPKYVWRQKQRIIQSGVSMMCIMGLFVVNRLIVIALTGSMDVYNAWKVEHMAETMILPIFAGVFGVYATMLFTRYRKVERNQTNVVVTSEPKEEVSASEKMENLDDPEKELERLLAIIKERY